ncbi:MAG TPA: hypothetical protein DCY89_06765 [Gammaproteobacteria bacterium]|nr:hypothetical protein [Gammaproteobacteria bacterium]
METGDGGRQRPPYQPPRCPAPPGPPSIRANLFSPPVGHPLRPRSARAPVCRPQSPTITPSPLSPDPDRPPEISPGDPGLDHITALRVLLVDARASLRHLMLETLRARYAVSAAGEHYSGEEACRDYLRLRPDVVILHLDLPGISGAETAHRLLQRQPRAALVLVGREHEGIRRDRVLQLGVRGYLRETRLRDELPAAVETVAGGGRYLDTTTARDLALNGQHPATAALEGLSIREFEIFCLHAGGHSLDAIAARLSLGYKTVAGYGTRIRAKLGVRTSAELAQLAARWGLVRG